MRSSGWVAWAAGCVACASGADVAMLTDSDTGVQADVAALTVVTFNTGSTEGLVLDPSIDGYGPEQAAASDAWYGDGLAWEPAITATAAWFATVRPDVVAFQEIFDVADCAAVPEDARPGFVCAGYAPGDPTVPERVLGPDYTVSCFPGHGDKCLAVRRDRVALAGCDAAGPCDGGLDGEGVTGCGQGARVARGRATLVATGASLQLVGVHGTSGASGDDQDCRVAQVDQVRGFLDGADAETATLVLGDLNTDPGRLLALDRSAVAWRDLVDGGALRWVTAVGVDTPATYAGLVTIDHVLATAGLTGRGCRTEGVTAGTATVYATPYFDHHPVVCTVDVALVGGASAD